jgi:hypothetical protein
MTPSDLLPGDWHFPCVLAVCGVLVHCAPT